MLKRRRAPSPSRIAIDPGGYHTRMFSETDGLLLDEPSIGLLDMDHQHSGALAVNRYGIVAADLFEGPASGKRLISPLQSDCLNNVGHHPRMLSYFLRQAKHEGLISKAPIVLLALPSDFTELQADQLRHACFTSGVSRVHVVDNGIATALGVGLPIDRPEPSVLIDFGARGARLYAYANNEIVASASIPCGGDLLTETLTAGIREHFGIHVSDLTAQETKHRVGSAISATYSHRLRTSCQVQGLAINENFDTQLTLSTENACEILQPTLTRAAAAIRTAVHALPSHFREHLKDSGMTLTGGGVQLAQIDQLVMEAADLPVEIVNRPLSTAARGGGKMLERIHGSLEIPEPA